MRRRAGRSLSALVVLAMAALPPGCGSAGRYPVTGSVTYQGKPATGASVHFRREGETAEEALAFPTGVVDAEGKFSLEVPGVGPGALPGKYKVLVLWPLEKDLNAPPTAAKKPGQSAAGSRRDPKSDADRLKFRYFKLDTPLLTAEVKPETNTLGAFELKD